MRLRCSTKYECLQSAAMVGDLPTIPLTSIVWDGIMAYPALLAVNCLALASCSREIKSVTITSPS
jgi:hypothetical protein